MGWRGNTCSHPESSLCVFLAVEHVLRAQPKPGAASPTPVLLSPRKWLCTIPYPWGEVCVSRHCQVLGSTFPTCTEWRGWADTGGDCAAGSSQPGAMLSTSRNSPGGEHGMHPGAHALSSTTSASSRKEALGSGWGAHLAGPAGDVILQFLRGHPGSSSELGQTDSCPAISGSTGNASAPPEQPSQHSPLSTLPEGRALKASLDAKTADVYWIDVSCREGGWGGHCTQQPQLVSLALWCSLKDCLLKPGALICQFASPWWWAAGLGWPTLQEHHGCCPASSEGRASLPIL